MTRWLSLEVISTEHGTAWRRMTEHSMHAVPLSTYGDLTECPDRLGQRLTGCRPSRTCTREAY